MKNWNVNRSVKLSTLVLLLGMTASAWAKPCTPTGNSLERAKPCRATAPEGGNALSYVAVTAAFCAGAIFLRRRQHAG
jgi:hypothetical protein